MISSFTNRVIHFLQANTVVVLFLLSLTIAGLLHGVNMFHYPYFESDEGTYLSQAYSVKTDGELAPYVYWYDHPPFGWITIAVFMDVLSNEWNAFGGPLYAGRFLMFLLHLVQVSLLFFIIKKLTRSPWMALLGVLLFTLPPLTTYFQRRVLLDNLMVTWVMLSIAILYVDNIKFRHVLLSGLFYGLAFLTKVTSAMFGPAILLLLLTAKWNIHKGFRVVGWLGVSGSIVCTWFLYALFKTEFFPVPDGSRVSLVGAVLYQASRDAGFYFWEEASSFRDNFGSWLVLDTTTVYILITGVGAAIILAIFSAKYRVIAIATLFYTLFLIRGAVVIGFYILPLVPFALISLVCLYHEASSWLAAKNWILKNISKFLYIILIFVILLHYLPKAEKYLTVDETTNQIEALRWIKENLPEDATILIDVYGMTELRNPHFVNDKVFMNADWYFKVSKDPEIRFDKYRDDWRNFDYVFISHEMLFQTSKNYLPVAYDAIRNSQPLMRWDQRSSSFIDIQNFISTNGDWAAVHRVNDSTRTQLQFAWNYYRQNYIQSYGQVVDPQTEVTTSEGQSYAMLQAVFMNDRDAFKGLWLWTQHQLQHRINDKLISWQWADDRQLDSNNATDADIDIALALIFASRVFNEPAYLEDSRVLLESIWRQTVVEINGLYYLLPAEKSTMSRGDDYLLNPSYFSPAHYRIFATVDTERADQWLELADDSYTILNRIKNSRGGVGLPPNWLMVNKFNGTFSSASPYISGGEADYFGYDAFRTFWRVALDVVWFENTRAENYLIQYNQFFRQEWNTYGNFATVYTTSGQRIASTDNLALSAGILSAVSVSSGAQLASEINTKLFGNTMYFDDVEELAYWGTGENYYDMNWIWFGQALFNENLVNVWPIR
jgi:endo-1,4-beta-D-glucanase Y